MDRKQLEDILSKTMRDMSLFVRDTDLTPNQIRHYVPDLIIKERAFVDVTYKVGGLVTDHRFTILSNHMTSMAMLEQGTNWGLCIAQKDSYFWVLDKYEYKGKHQILLLHLPKEDWEAFKQIPIESQLRVIKILRERFESTLQLPPIPEVTSQEWLDRCRFPIGMDDDGRLFPLGT